jgi:thioredoxin:protein disulfide reductase
MITFIGFFLAGLAVNLTPCVYPMLTVTASLFKAKHAAGEKLRYSFAKAFAYFLGIVVTYSTLGYLAASTGKIFGSALQNNWVLGAVGLMMLALAMSMFGLFQLRAPAEFLNRMAGFRKASFLGLFFSGLLVGIFAAPCVGPPVLALLAAVANNGNPQFGLAAFFVFSVGMGLPYLLLGTFSGLVNKLPKAGQWLVWIERTLGVVLLGFAFFYLSLALHGHSVSSKANSIWKPYSEEQVKQAMLSHKPVVIDFFAEWCYSCHELDQTVFMDPKVLERLKDSATLRVDATDIDAPQVQAITDKYAIIGLPTVVFLDAKGDEIMPARMEGAGTSREFLRSLDMQSMAMQKGTKENAQ